jgi:aminoglycoside 6'-N-acetyltransferase
LTSCEIRGEATVVRPVGDADAELLVAWHDDSEVARYWDDERFTREQMLARLRRPDVDAYLVETGGEPVGYLQVSHERERGGIDMFLVPAARGRGLGPDAGRAIVDPYLWNEAAIRGWRRAGFRDIEEHEPDANHTARWLLMEFRD